jgi:glycosyltransferase involved in cell wall biosynthesis
MPYIVDDQKTGFVIEEKSVFSLTEKVKCLIKDPVLRERFGLEGNLKFNCQYTASKMVQKTEELYCKLLK